MAEIAPFKGIRYDTSVAGDLSRLTSPPYDIISPEDRVYYHKLHPANFVRLVLGEEFESDTETDNRFTRARAYLDQWLADGILRQDREPAIYAYRQRFDRGGPKTVRGITCAVRLHDYADGVILPHENTLAKPKSQLIQLMRETRANLDSIYGLYADPDGALAPILDQATSCEPDAETVDKNGVVHALWSIADPAAIGTAAAFLADRPIAIADGHHRYETALAYRDEMRAQRAGAGGELASDYVLMTIVNVHEPDMTIFPTHRVVGNLLEDDLAGLDAGLAELFTTADSSRAGLIADMARLRGIGVYRPGRAQVATLEADPARLIAGSEAARRLELNVLHKLILERILGIDDEKLRNQTHIVYTRDPEEAMALVDSGERQIAFLLNEIDVKSVLEIASAGERMPQKATYFYPKLASGLVLRKME